MSRLIEASGTKASVVEVSKGIEPLKTAEEEHITRTRPTRESEHDRAGGEKAEAGHDHGHEGHHHGEFDPACLASRSTMPKSM